MGKFMKRQPNGKQENHHRINLIVLEKYFVQLTNKSSDLKQLKITGRHQRAKRVR